MPQTPRLRALGFWSNLLASHSYLVTLQKVAVRLAKKVRAQLQELAGKGTVSKVADVITDSFIQAKPLVD